MPGKIIICMESLKDMIRKDIWNKYDNFPKIKHQTKAPKCLADIKKKQTEKC